VEQSQITADARRFMLFGDQAAERGDPEGAREEYEKAWSEWAQIFEAHPDLVHDAMADDLKEAIGRYELVLDQLDEKFPEDFPLKTLRERDEIPEEFRGALPPDAPGGQPGEPDDPNANQELNAEPEREEEANSQNDASPSEPDERL
jgi:hypothetical protein